MLGDFLVLIVYILLQISENVYNKMAESNEIINSEKQLYSNINNWGIIGLLWAIISMHFIMLVINKFLDY